MYFKFISFVKILYKYIQKALFKTHILKLSENWAICLKQLFFLT